MEKGEDQQQSRTEVLCRVCGDKASGKHYGVASCDGCRGFFKRSIRRNLDYVCKESNRCIVDATRRNQCQACRFKKCLQVNMKRDAVQHERAPRTTTTNTKPKYLPCYPYYFPFKPTFYGSPFISPHVLSAAAASRLPPFEMSKFDLFSPSPLSIPSSGSGSSSSSTMIPSVLSPLSSNRLTPRLDPVAAPQGLLSTRKNCLSSSVDDSMLLTDRISIMIDSPNRPNSQNNHLNSSLNSSHNTPTNVCSSNTNNINSSHHLNGNMNCSSSIIQQQQLQLLQLNRQGAVDNTSSNNNDNSHMKSSSPTAASTSSKSPEASHERDREDRDSSSGGLKEDEVSSSGVDMQTQSFKLDLNLFTLNNESIYESAAKLLFLSVKWARSVPSFLHLPYGDQSVLLEECWPELFILSAAQWSLPIDEGLLAPGSMESRLRHESLIAEIRYLRDVLSRIASLRPDHTELACLKALVLFKPETPNLRELVQVEILQDQTHLMLQEYCVTKQPPSKIRFGKLLMILPSIRKISGKTLEELFFKLTVGDVPIERLLCDMFKA